MYVNSSPWPIIINKKVISSRCMHRSAHVRYSRGRTALGRKRVHNPFASMWRLFRPAHPSATRRASMRCCALGRRRPRPTPTLRCERSSRAPCPRLVRGRADGEVPRRPTGRHFLSLASFDRVSGARHGGSVTLVITAAVPTARRR